MRISETELNVVRRRARHAVSFGGVVLLAAMLAGCDAIGGNVSSWLPADIDEQIVVFIQDFARQALAAWLF